MNKLNFPDPWLEALGKAFCVEFLEDMEKKLCAFRAENITIFPPSNDIFKALDLVNFESVKILILGQDPYHGFDQANGLSFSVNDGISIPPSLKNIFVELNNDLNIPIPNHGNLTAWATQGVLLLNSALTVELEKPNSHRSLGWDKLTNKIISQLSNRGDVIFVLWGNFAQKKEGLINRNRNSILCASHPSPLSAYRGFFGCNHFGLINKLLRKNKSDEINWNLG
ncbi:MAG: uracil-DNA glycosylase [SAR86 cluster bacterium]|nr:uracil-DNA glycosylase [SAR86 cluster bacterium]